MMLAASATPDHISGAPPEVQHGGATVTNHSTHCKSSILPRGGLHQLDVVLNGFNMRRRATLR
eukprot:1063478-Prorocentrum_minimum.AAC.3